MHLFGSDSVAIGKSNALPANSFMLVPLLSLDLNKTADCIHSNVNQACYGCFCIDSVILHGFTEQLEEYNLSM